MNQSERYKVNRKRTLQAILRAYRNKQLPDTDLVYSVELPPGTDLLGMYREFSRTPMRWHPRRIGKQIYNIRVKPNEEYNVADTEYSVSWSGLAYDIIDRMENDFLNK